MLLTDLLHIFRRNNAVWTESSLYSFNINFQNEVGSMQVSRSVYTLYTQSCIHSIQDY